MRAAIVAAASGGLAYTSLAAWLFVAHPLPLALALLGSAAAGGWGARRWRRAPETLALFLFAGWALALARLAFWNASSPLFPRSLIGPPAWALLVLLALAAALLPLVLAAAGVEAAAAAARARPRMALAGVALALAVAAVLWPVACDWHESFEETASRRCACVGWEIPWYPPYISDASETVLCVGLERPTAPAAGV